MAYIPPHKRHSRGGSSSSAASPSPTPIPESLSPQFQRSLSFKSSSARKIRDRAKQGLKIVYAQDAISKWFPVGLASDYSDNDPQFKSMTRLEPISVESFERKSGEKPLALVLNHDCVKGSLKNILKECTEEKRIFLENPWEFISENVKQDLFSAFQRVKNEMKENEFEEVKPTLVARFGRVLFHCGQATLPGSNLRQLKRSFDTNISTSYTEYIVNEVVPKFGIHFEEEKELYHVKLSDNVEPDSSISCKCTLAKDHEKLELYKASILLLASQTEWNHVRHMVSDMSCLGRNIDLRLMLFTKRIVKSLTDDEIKCIKCLIGSAILDPEVKGGLRWTLGRDSSGGRYTVIGVWHISAKKFRNSSIRLKVKDGDRFNFRYSSGDDTRGVTLKMPGIVSHLQEQKIQDDLYNEMLSSNLKLIWDSCLSFGSIT